MTFLRKAASLGVMSISLAYTFCSPARAVEQDASAWCSALEEVDISASKITLPTAGAEVMSTILIKASDQSNQNGEYCKIIGKTKPVDPNAPDIVWQVNLPTAWNGKLLQYGGGGYNGSVPPTTDKTTLGLDVAPTPLAQGYVTFGSDSGHQAPNADDASFAKNDEAMLTSNTRVMIAGPGDARPKQEGQDRPRLASHGQSGSSLCRPRVHAENVPPHQSPRRVAPGLTLAVCAPDGLACRGFSYL